MPVLLEVTTLLDEAVLVLVVLEALSALAPVPLGSPV
jgi:hypothetical protein